ELTLKDVSLRLAGSETDAEIPNVRLAPGQRLLVSGPSGAGKSSLFRALAGIWPIAGGSIRLPPDSGLLALPQRPYFPLGTVRQGLTYPMLAEAVADAEVRDAMEAVGLGHLIERLDTEAEWSTALAGGEQQRVGFARALIHRPNILLLDEAVSMLDRSDARALYRLVAERLPATVVIAIGGNAALAGTLHRAIELRSASAPRAREPETLAPAAAAALA